MCNTLLRRAYWQQMVLSFPSEHWWGRMNFLFKSCDWLLFEGVNYWICGYISKVCFKNLVWVKCFMINLVCGGFCLFYSCVYKCVCQQHSEQMYSDLIKKITNHLERVSKELQVKNWLYWFLLPWVFLTGCS